MSATRIRELAISAFVRAGCCGLARVDFFVDGERVLVNELNTMPGFTRRACTASLFEASGIPYPELLDRLVDLAIERHAAPSSDTATERLSSATVMSHHDRIGGRRRRADSWAPVSPRPSRSRGSR